MGVYNVMLPAEATSELSESLGKSLYKPEEKHIIEGGQFKARKKEVLAKVLQSVKNELGTTCFELRKVDK